jgi:hypothetical protein
MALNNKNILLIPFWIENALNRLKLPLNQILDLSSIYDSISKEDLASVISLNQDGNKTVFGCSVYCSTMAWGNDSELLNKLYELNSVVSPTLYDRLFSQDAYNSKYQSAFRIVDIDSSTTLVIIYPGYFGGSESAKYQSEIRRAMLKICYVYQGYTEAAKESYFEKYLRELPT